jgi:hypothetical protein
LRRRAPYHDCDEEFVPEDILFERFTRKRRSCEHEREVRAIVPFVRDGSAAGLAVECDLSQLIEEVRVAPSAPSWFRDLVEAVAERHDLSVLVRQSDRDASPLHSRRRAALDHAAAMRKGLPSAQT